MQFFLSNLCQSWVLPQMKQALLWAFGLAQPCPPQFSHPIHPLFLTASAKTGEHAHGHFFFRATTFPLIARMPCGATVHTLPQTPSQVMPAAHRHICSSPRYSSTAHERWRQRGERGRASGLFQEKKKKWAVLLSKNFPRIAVKRRTQGNCQEQKVGKRSQHVKWMI